MKQGKLNILETLNNKIINKKTIELNTNCNFQKAEIIFNFLNSFVNEVQEDPDIVKYYIPKTEIICAYSDGSFSTQTYYGELIRDCYSLGYQYISNIVSIICTDNENSIHQIHFTGRIDNDESYEYELNIKVNEYVKENELFEKFKYEFKDAYEQSAGAIDSYIEFFTNYAVDSNNKIYNTLLEVLNDIKLDKNVVDRKGAIEYLKNYYRDE